MRQLSSFRGGKHDAARMKAGGFIGRDFARISARSVCARLLCLHRRRCFGLSKWRRPRVTYFYRSVCDTACNCSYEVGIMYIEQMYKILTLFLNAARAVRSKRSLPEVKVVAISLR